MSSNPGVKQMRFWTFLLVFTFGCLVEAHNISGKVDVILKGDKKKSDLSGVIVYLSAPDANISASMLKKPYSLSTKNKQFNPTVMAVPLGASVNFPNYDPIFHNLFSVSAPNDFDLGLYKGGASKSKVFEKPGIVKVFCNVHPGMTATLLVAESAYFTLADKAGNFVLKSVPSGSYEIRAYSPEGQASKNIESMDQSITMNLTIDGKTFKRIQHKNKFGKDYNTNQDDRY